jgi:hypothetical protein
VTISFLVTSLTKAGLPRLLSLARRRALGIVLVVPNFFHLRMLEANVLFETFNAAEHFWYPSSDLFLDTLLSLSSTDNFVNLTVWFLPNQLNLPQVDSNQLNFPQVDSNEFVETSQG